MLYSFIILEIVFSCQERFRLSHSQWKLLCRLSYGIYATGGTFENRPDPVYQDPVLEINFSTVREFNEYHQRALSWTPSHLVDFSVDEISANRVVGSISANHTPEMTLIRPQSGPSDADSDVVFLRIDHMI